MWCGSYLIPSPQSHTNYLRNKGHPLSLLNQNQFQSVIHFGIVVCTRLYISGMSVTYNVHVITSICLQTIMNVDFYDDRVPEN